MALPLTVPPLLFVRVKVTDAPTNRVLLLKAVEIIETV
jgi:hypothetical protein